MIGRQHHDVSLCQQRQPRHRLGACKPDLNAPGSALSHFPRYLLWLAQAMGQKKYVSPDEGLPANLAGYKLATQIWDGNVAAYDDWVAAETFEPLNANAHAVHEQ